MITVFGSIGLLILLSFFKSPIVLSIVLASLVAGQLAGLTVVETISSFNHGVKNGAVIALNYGCLGAFAAGLAKSGIPSWACENLSQSPIIKQARQPEFIILFIVLIAALISQNILPIHVAFIPLMIPVMLFLMSNYQLDRRAVACCICCGLVIPYMTLPIGFGNIYINEILYNNLNIQGVKTHNISIYKAMWMPALGMITGLAFAVFVSYRKPRNYPLEKVHIKTIHPHTTRPSQRNLLITFTAILTALTLQVITGSMIVGSLIGFSLFIVTGVINVKESDDIFMLGLKMMASIAFIMIAAQGFAAILADSGEILPLAKTLAATFKGHEYLAIFSILITGLVITLGIGSSFSTVPIIASVFVPITLEMQLEPIAIVTLIATAGALGDACSPVSETTLAPSMSLNADNQHDHFKDTIIPTFFHITLPLLLFGWVGVILLNR
jgi:hypothetical protein